MRSRRFALLPLAASVLVLSAFAFAACGDDDTNDSNGATGDVDNSAVFSAINFLSNAGLHGIDDSINDDATVPPTARNVMLRGATVLRVTEWPESLRAQAASLADAMVELAEVLHDDPVDMARAGELAATVHEDEHDFSADVWAYLQAEAGIEGGGGGHD